MREKKHRIKVTTWLLSFSLLFTTVAAPIGASAAGKTKLNKKKVTITVGKTVKLRVLNKKKAVKWSSSKPKIASVNKKGKVKGLKKGTAKIIAKTAGKKYTCKVTVKAKGTQTKNTEEPNGGEAAGTQAPAITTGMVTAEPTSSPARSGKPLIIATISPTETPGVSSTPVEPTKPADTLIPVEPSEPPVVSPTPEKTTEPPVITPTPAPETYAVTILVQKDAALWPDSGKKFQLTKNNGASFITNLNVVENGTYDIYEGNTDTFVDVTVNGAAVTATIDYFTVTFCDGTVIMSSPEQQVVLKGRKAAAPVNTPGKTGYSFVGWVTEDGGDIAFDFASREIYGKTSIYASWKQDSSKAAYKAEYYMQNMNDDGYPAVASASEMIEGTIGAKVPVFGKSFEGFTALQAEETAIAADGNTVVKYYYTRNKYNLSWNANGGSIKDTVYTRGEVKFGASIQAPVNVIRTGYTFAGWNTILASTMPAKDMAYSAKWTPNPDTAYKVEHYQQNINDDGYPAVPTETDNETGTTGSKATAHTKSYTGFTVSSVTEGNIAADGSTVLKCYYTRNKYNLVWNANGGTINGTSYTSGSVKFGVSIQAPVNVTRTGYTFAGWNPTPEKTMPAQDMTYTAKWTAVATPTPTGTPSVVSYTVKHYQQNINDDGYPSTPVKTENLTGVAGSQVTPAVAKFGGGFSQPSAQTVTLKADGSTVVEYKYPRKKFTLEWDLDGGTATNAYTSGSMKYGAPIVPPEPKKAGYTFVDWDDVLYDEMPDYDMTYTAIWEEGEDPIPSPTPDIPVTDITKVTLGMTTSQLTSGVGSPVRIDSTPQGYQGYVYNPSGTYEKYMLVYVDNGVVVGMATMSKSFSYQNLVSIGDSSSSLTGFKLMGSYDYEAGYLCETDTAYVMAFADHQGDSNIYAVQIFAKQSGSGTTVKLDDLIKAENLSYDNAVNSCMAKQLAEWVNAFRVYKGVPIAVYHSNATAQNHSNEMASTGSVGSGTDWKQRFNDNYKSIVGLEDGDTLGMGENNGAHSPDAFGFVAWWADDTSSGKDSSGVVTAYKNLYKSTITFDGVEEPIDTYYLCTGFSYNSSQGNKTFATLDFFY
ncbi:MAG: InlB B-repeat-containing protein [Lachnospiraceae bacterium]|nr:InlB B-repeat-containing protein [Lachnospiraceae bacterium]